MKKLILLLILVLSLSIGAFITIPAGKKVDVCSTQERYSIFKGEYGKFQELRVISPSEASLSLLACKPNQTAYLYII